MGLSVELKRMLKISGKRMFFLFFFYFLSLTVAHSQLKVSVVYCGIGTEIYTIFGHIGIRITNGPSDIVYSFGTFDPSTPDFLSKYIKGTLDYSLSREDYLRFIQDYKEAERAILVYELSITDRQASTLESKLLSTYLSGERFYRYQFLKDNCSTRIFQMLQETLGEELQYKNAPLDTTYRASLNNVLQYNSLLRLPINCLLGSIGEEKLNTVDITYLPNFLTNVLLSSRIKNHKSDERKLVDARVVAYESNEPLKATYYDFIIIMVVVIIILFSRSRYVFLFTSLFGSLLLFLMLYSYRVEFAYNYNLLLFCPLDFFLLYPRMKHYQLILRTSIVLNIIYIGVFLIMGIGYIPLVIFSIAILVLKTVKSGFFQQRKSTNPLLINAE